ncbi:hypothetical protein CEXT_238381 [Caerostris extrusa]|uniref:Uncharacterized protein n=1 Tax=Caerostris extrusa TaxID=172846 RepID=A0AAV4T993_CAEEX|nr:hypothetical protein CEXT_238381 [Caerostris extrusa]
MGGAILRMENKGVGGVIGEGIRDVFAPCKRSKMVFLVSPLVAFIDNEIKKKGCVCYLSFGRSAKTYAAMCRMECLMVLFGGKYLLCPG